MKKIFLYLHVLICFNLYAQNDEDKITEAKIAFEKYNDCQGANLALSEVTSEGQKDLFFIYYSALVYECMKKYNKAIYYFEKFNYEKKDSSINEKLSELRYLLRKKINECEKCHGAGEYYGDAPCSKCGGYGFFINSAFDGTITCKTCRGKGTINELIKCNHSDF